MTGVGMVFEQELEILRTEAEAAAQFLYAYLAIHMTAERNPEVVDLLNTAPLFWNTALGALQTSAFIVLGRVFDDDKDSHRVDRLLRLATDNLQIFTLDALAVRKQGNNPTRPDWLDDYMSTVYVPSVTDFQQLQKKVDEHRAVYRAKYKPIRNKVFAHKDIVSNANVHSLFSQTNIYEWQTLTLFLQSLHNTIWQLYVNGIKPELQEPPHSEEDTFSCPAVAGRQIPPQEKITREVANFLLKAANKKP
jgi:hypothetical protein